jgi:hypothetical protein
MSFPAPAQAGVEDDSLLALLRPLLVLCPIIYLKFSHILNQAFNLVVPEIFLRQNYIKIYLGI